MPYLRLAPAPAARHSSPMYGVSSGLEEIASSFEGVERVFAMQAGREVRIAVSPTVVDDLAAGDLARRIARRLEEDLNYPGQIEVTVIREFRATDFAR